MYKYCKERKLRCKFLVKIPKLLLFRILLNYKLSDALYIYIYTHHFIVWRIEKLTKHPIRFLMRTTPRALLKTYMWDWKLCLFTQGTTQKARLWASGMTLTWHESSAPFPAHSMLPVMRDGRYFICRHCWRLRMGTCTSWTSAGSVPPSDVRPHPITVPTRPAGSVPESSEIHFRDLICKAAMS